MFLPDCVRFCIERLENAGFAAYAVGGCVRDDCLGLTPHDYDLCTAALPEQTEATFSDCSLFLMGKKHGTIGVVVDGQVMEITTFRREGTYTDNRHPDSVFFVPEIEEDLARRDFTVNAIGWSPTRGYADPFEGRMDLKNQVLRAVGDPETRFREDSLRILRGVRFAVRFGLQVEAETERAMIALAPLMENLARERVFEELNKLLPLIGAEDLKRFAPVFAAVIPELEPMVGFDQRSPHHAYDLYTHVAHVVNRVPREETLRWAALLHDIGKIPTATVDENGRGHYYGHAKESARMADEILHRLKAPTALRQQVVTLIGQHMTRLEPDRKFLRRRLSRLGWETTWQLLALQEADMGSKGTGKETHDADIRQIQDILEQLRQEDACLRIRDLQIGGHDLMALGYQGREIGEKLQWLLEQVLDEKLENQKEKLLEALQQWK